MISCFRLPLPYLDGLSLELGAKVNSFFLKLPLPVFYYTMGKGGVSQLPLPPDPRASHFLWRFLASGWAQELGSGSFEQISTVAPGM